MLTCFAPIALKEKAARPERFTHGSVEVNGATCWLDDNEGRPVWFQVPDCVCGEPLVTDSEFRVSNHMAPVEYVVSTGRMVVICESCGAVYEVQR